MKFSTKMCKGMQKVVGKKRLACTASEKKKAKRRKKK